MSRLNSYFKILHFIWHRLQKIIIKKVITKMESILSRTRTHIGLKKNSQT